ncbi:MAG TPA: ABC transporter substrate-binding protein [Syntrophobacteraceae bacterium]|nr:ABC transporter substrate-binding protein [Syntrophobacteraceae bacterium]
MVHLWQLRAHRPRYAGLRTTSWILLWAVACFIPNLTAAAEPVEDTPLKKAVLIPQWQPQAQFAGFYVAYQKGFYRDLGIDLQIRRGGPESPSSHLLAEGEADFGTMFLSTAIEKRAQGLQLVNIGQLVQCSSLMLIAKRSSGVFTPPDIDGKHVGLWGAEFQIQPLAFFRKHHLKITPIPQAATVNLFLRGGTDVTSAMWYNEYHMILNAGINPEELTTFFFFDYDMNFPEDGIYCLESTLRRDPDLCCRFVQASLQGWRYAFQHPEEALDIVMSHVDEANIATDRVHQRWMFNRMRDLMVSRDCGAVVGAGRNAAATMIPTPVDSEFGNLDPTDYQRVAQELQAAGVIDWIPDYGHFYQGCVAAHEN